MLDKSDLNGPSKVEDNRSMDITACLPTSGFPRACPRLELGEELKKDSVPVLVIEY